MKQIFIIIFFYFSINSYGQQIFGVYKNQEGEQMIFRSNGMTEFSLFEPSCLGTFNLVGNGQFKIHRRKLIITTSDYLKSFGSHYKLLHQKDLQNNTIVKVSVLDSMNKRPLVGVQLFFYDKKGGVKSQTSTDYFGESRLYLPYNIKDSILLIYYLGYQPVKLPLFKGKESEYIIYLEEGNTALVENKILKFAFAQSNDTIIFKSYGRETKVHPHKIHTLYKE